MECDIRGKGMVTAGKGERDIQARQADRQTDRQDKTGRQTRQDRKTRQARTEQTDRTGHNRADRTDHFLLGIGTGGGDIRGL